MKIVLIGYGAMNQRVARLAESKGHEIIGVIVRDATKDYPYPTFELFADDKEQHVEIYF